MQRLLPLLVAFIVAGCVAAREPQPPRAEMYPARSGHFSRDEERAIVLASAKLAGGSQKRLDAFYQVTRKGNELWVLVLVSGSRSPERIPMFSAGSFWTVVVSPQWTVSRVMAGWYL